MTRKGPWTGEEDKLLGDLIDWKRMYDEDVLEIAKRLDRPTTSIKSRVEFHLRQQKEKSNVS